MLLPLGALLLSIGAQGLGVLLSGSTENSMRRQTQHSGVGWVGGGLEGLEGWGKREYKHNLMSHTQINCSVKGEGFGGIGSEVSLGQSVWVGQSVSPSVRPSVRPS